MLRICFIMMLFAGMLLSSHGVAQQKDIPLTGLEKFNLSVDDVEKMTALANGGDGDAAFKLANYFRFIRSDNANSVKWTKKAAELGNVVAQYNYAFILSDMPDAKSKKTAVFWYRRAADSGHVMATMCLAEAYAEGVGCGRNYRQSRIWYEKAALLGEELGMIKLAEYLSNGQGGIKDEISAYAWILVASSRIRQDSVLGKKLAEKRNSFEVNLTRVDLEHGRELFKKLSSTMSNRGDEAQKELGGAALHSDDNKTFIKSSAEQHVQSIEIWFEIANKGNKTSEVCIYQTPLEGKITSALMFKVTDSLGKDVEYRGMQMKRRPPSKEAGDYITLEPGKSAGAYADLTNSYAWRPGKYDITFFGNELLNKLPQSNKITITVLP